MTFILTLLTREDLETVVVVRRHINQHNIIGSYVLSGADSRLVEEEPFLRIGPGIRRLQVQYVDSQGRTALIFLEDEENAPYLKVTGNIKAGAAELKIAPEGKKPLFASKRRVGLHLKRDGILVLEARNDFSWVLAGQKTKEVRIEIPAFVKKREEGRKDLNIQSLEI